MSATADSAHPRWCDARSHESGDSAHIGAPVVHRALVDDAEVALGLRADGSGPVTIGLGIENLLSTWPDGSPIEAEVALLPCEAEVLAHRLLALAAAARGAGSVETLPRQRGG
jgi:hypothetical protein